MSDDTLFTELVGLLHTEELIRLQRRCQRFQKPLLGAIIHNEVLRRDEEERAKYATIRPI